MPSSSDGKARARVQSVDSGVESVVVPVLLQQQVVLQGLTALARPRLRRGEINKGDGRGDHRPTL
jgi:hypothetical protein